MALEDYTQDESDQLFRRKKKMEAIKESIAGNYHGREAAILSHLFVMLFTTGPVPEKLMEIDFVIKLANDLLPCIAVSQYARRQLLLSAGHIAGHIYFSTKGMARGFYTHKRGKEVTDYLWNQHSFITVPASFFQQRPSHLFIDVMSGTELLSISFQDLSSCIEKYPVVEIFSRNVILQYHNYEAKRSQDFTFLTAWERYLQLLKTHPDIEQQVSKEVIASYLHIEPQSLSRMLKKKKHP
ncbi:MAG: Crp/Fnr family transcriptional regulator [Ginsengibacter sp.]